MSFINYINALEWLIFSSVLLLLTYFGLNKFHAKEFYAFLIYFLLVVTCLVTLFLIIKSKISSELVNGNSEGSGERIIGKSGIKENDMEKRE